MVSSCTSTLTIVGSSSLVEELLTNGFNPEKYLPTPEHLAKTDRDWIPWRYEHWGTKRIYRQTVIRKGPTGLILKIITAVYPPLAFLKHLLQLHPELYMKCEYFNEDGMGGVWIAMNGEITHHTWREMDEDDLYTAFCPLSQGEISPYQEEESE